MKRSVLIIMIILSVFMLSGCTGDKTGLTGSWKVDTPDEYDLRLGANSKNGEIISVVYDLSSPDWFNEGSLAILYEFSDTSKRDCYDVGYYSVKGNRIDLMGTGSYTINDDVLTICYDDGTVRTFTRIQ
jgi:hypothetical protein